MGDNYLYSSDYQLPLSEYASFILDYPGVADMEAAGMWEMDTLPVRGHLKEGEEGANTMSTSQMSTDKVQVTSPGHKVVEPPDTKTISKKVKDPDSGLGLPGHGIDFGQRAGRFVTSVSIPICQLPGTSSENYDGSKMSRCSSTPKTETPKTEKQKQKRASVKSGQKSVKRKKIESKLFLL